MDRTESGGTWLVLTMHETMLVPADTTMTMLLAVLQC